MLFLHDLTRRSEIAYEAADAEIAAQGDAALDLLAEELRLAHDALGEITRRVTPDALPGEIFGRFCLERAPTLLNGDRPPTRRSGLPETAAGPLDRHGSTPQVPETTTCRTGISSGHERGR